MKINIELSDQEEATIMEKIIDIASKQTESIISDYFNKISQEDFVLLMRRSLSKGVDNYFSHYMQYYIENNASNIYKKMQKDISLYDKKK